MFKTFARLMSLMLVGQTLWIGSTAFAQSIKKLEVSNFHIEVVIDSSQKMKQEVDGRKKSEILNEHLKELFLPLAEVDTQPDIAFRTFGHRAGTRQKTESCEDSELIVPFGEQRWEQAIQETAKLSTKGYSPLAYSLEAVAKDVQDIGDAPLAIVVIGTSSDSCDGDPVIAAEELRNKIPQATIYSINFFGDSDAQQQLTELAADTGGKIYDISDDTAVAKTFNEVGTMLAGLAATEDESNMSIIGGYNDTILGTDGTGPEAGENSKLIDDSTNTENAEPIADSADTNTDTEPVNTETTEEANVATNDEQPGFFSSSLFKYGLGGLVMLVILLTGVGWIMKKKKAQFATEGVTTDETVDEQITPIESEVSPPEEQAMSDENSATISATTPPPIESGSVDLSGMIGTEDAPLTPAATQQPATPIEPTADKPDATDKPEDDGTYGLKIIPK